MKLINYYGNTKLTGIYTIRNLVNNKVYIGSTKKSFASRKIRHLGLLRKNIHYNEHLQNAWNYYGEQNFSFEILFICSPNECEKYEGEFIKLYSSNNRNSGYNIASVLSYKCNYELSENHNIEKSIRKIKKSITLNGFNTKERGISKPFNVYDLNGNFIKEYKNANEFILGNGGSKSHISVILNKRKLFYRKMIILFSNDILTDNDIINAKKMDIKKINLFNTHNMFIKTFNSANECAEFIGCKPSEIRMCCLGKRSRIKNYKTKYYEY